MLTELFADARVRRTYIATKVGVFVLAAGATWPLSRVIGDKAWIGLGIFGLVLIALSALVLAVGASASTTVVDDQEQGEAEEDGPDPSQPVVLPVEDHLDLHPFPPRDVPDVVADYLQEAHAKGFREVRLIHGKGIGVQRERVQSLLSRHPLVASYHDAPPERGSWGATVAYLLDSPEAPSRD